jgi:predicted kinase
LIVLNGPPGSGKSTLAQRFVDEHPLALNLDVDRIRALIGGWRDVPDRSGPLARAIALAAARTHLAAGHDVVIPQFLGRPAFLEQVERLAHEVGADFREIVLLDSKENALRRFTSRAATNPTAAAMVAHAGGLDELSTMYDRLLAIIASRPTARVVPTTDGQPEQAYQDFLDSLS